MHGTGAPTPRSSPDLVFTGGCEVSLERAVVPYRTRDDLALPGGRASDLGVGVVLEGPREGRGEILDLGSGQSRVAELAPPVLVHGWIFTTPFMALKEMARSGEGRGELPALAAGVLGRLAFSPLSRPLFLRAGFRDLSLDLDPHEGTAIRLGLPGGGVSRAHMDYDRGVLVFRTGRSEPHPALLAALPDAFPRRALFRVTSGAGQGSVELHVQLAELHALDEVRAEMRRLRRGLLHLLARFDEGRYRAVMDALEGFGERDLLGAVAARRTPPAGRMVRERVVVPRGGDAPRRSGRVH